MTKTLKTGIALILFSFLMWVGMLAAEMDPQETLRTLVSPVFQFGTEALNDE